MARAIRMLLLPFAAIGALAGADTMIRTNDMARSVEENVCNSLTGPFCLHLGAAEGFAPHMTPIDPPGAAQATSSERSHEKQIAIANERKKRKAKKKKVNASTCVFQRFENSWMDAGGDLNDIMSQLVTSAAECEQLCCAHPKCQSYTFWMGNTCFLRATKNIPRKEANSLSANKLH